MKKFYAMNKIILAVACVLLSACVTVEYGNGVTHRRLPVDGEYAHFFRWDWCRHIGWMKSTEATEECRCFDEMGGVLPGCIGNPNVPKIVRDGIVIYDPKDYFKQ